MTNSSLSLKGNFWKHTINIDLLGLEQSCFFCLDYNFKFHEPADGGLAPPKIAP